MAFPANILVGGICLLLSARLMSYYRSRLRGRPPPGPRRLPLVGNVRDIPAPHEYPWLKYRDWCLEYNSDIIRLNALGSNIVVLDTLKAAKDLLDRRSTIYSGRPHMTMLGELAGFEWSYILSDYGEDWRVCRKMTHHEFNATAFKKYRPILAHQAQGLVRRMAQEPVTHVTVHLKYMTGASILQITYGIKALPERDPFIALTEAGQGAFNRGAISPFLMDMLPLLRYIPAWFPGAGFKRQAAIWREAAISQLEVPYADYQHREEIGKADECMAKAIAEMYGTDQAAERRAKMTTASMYLGGSETVAAVMHTFFLAMLLYFDIQACARHELEAVLGAYHLPTFEDFGSVPYIDAMIRELLRWQPIIRLSLPQKLREDDVYNGYHLEKDSLVIVNIWSILHDEKVYPDPRTFTPNRFLKNAVLNPNILDPQDVAFGFGRRVCPGQIMAYETMWITIAVVLMCAEICLAKDDEGREIEVKDEIVSSAVTEPRPFPCCVRFRSEAHAALLDRM